MSWSAAASSPTGRVPLIGEDVTVPAVSTLRNRSGEVDITVAPGSRR